MPARRRAVWLAALCLLPPRPAAAQGAAPKVPIDSLVARAARDSLDPITHHDLGVAYVAARRYDEGEREFLLAAALAPQYADPYLELAQLPEARGENYWKRREREAGRDDVRAALEQAHRYYRRAFLINPLVDLRLMADHYQAYRRQPGQLFYFWWSQGLADAVAAMHRNDFPKAFATVTRLEHDSRARPDRSGLPTAVLWLRGLLGARLGEYEEALGDIGTLTGRTFAAETSGQRGALFSTNDYRYTLATLRYLAGHYDEAIATFRRSLEFDVGLYQAHIQMARMFEVQKKWDEAIAERQAAVTVDPDDGSLIVDLGSTLISAGRMADAEGALQRAVVAAPRDPRAWYLLGVVALRTGHRDSARAALTRFVAIAPSRFAEQISEARTSLASLP